MLVRTFSVFLCLTMMFLVGCGDGEPTPSGDDANPTDNPAPADAPAAEDQAIVVPEHISVDPIAVTKAFIAAARQGHKNATFALMTSKAREALEKETDFMRLPVSEKATLTVGEANQRNDETVWVPTILTDFTPEGVCKEYEMVWGLRKQTEGWRIGGVAVEVVPGRPPMILDFENPEEQRQKTEMAIEEKRKYEEAQAAAQPATTPPTQPPQPIRQATHVTPGQATPGATIPR